MNFEGILEELKTGGLTLVTKLGFALIIWIVGSFLIRKIDYLIENRMNTKKVDASLKSFARSLMNAVLYLVLVISVVSTLGVQTSSLVAIVGAAGLAVGLALQGSLSNFAGGVLIIIFRPFGVGDFIEAGGKSGTVKDIQIFSTIIDTPDNKRVIIPNSQLSNDVIVNYSKNDMRRVDFVFSIDYNDNLYAAKDLITRLVGSHEMVLKDKDVFVRVSEYADSSINFTARVWVKKEDYWTVYFDIMEKIKGEFDKAGLSIPYPQMDLHIEK